jgi:hypothetical protein
MSDAKHLGADISIYRTQSCGKTVMRCEVRDATSRVQALVFEILPENLMLALTGFAHQPCDAVWHVSQLGRKHESKIMVVPFPRGTESFRNDMRLELAREAVKPFEVDGWVARVDDLLNHHNNERGSCNYRVAFFRFVDAPQEKEDGDDHR